MLDTLLGYERKCSYYTDSLPYRIYVCKVPTDRGDSIIIASIEGNEEKGLLLYKELLGCLSYKGHDFFIRGRDLINSMVMEGEKRTFRYWANFPAYADDSWGRYDFAYYNDKYYLILKVNECECKGDNTSD